MSEQTKKPKKQKPKRAIPKGLEPKRPFTSKKIFRVIVFSIVGSLSVILITQQIGGASESGSISEIGLIFGIIMGIVPLTLYQLKEVQRRDSVTRFEILVPVLAEKLSNASSIGIPQLRFALRFFNGGVNAPRFLFAVCSIAFMRLAPLRTELKSAKRKTGICLSTLSLL